VVENPPVVPPCEAKPPVEGAVPPVLNTPPVVAGKPPVCGVVPPVLVPPVGPVDVPPVGMVEMSSVVLEQALTLNSRNAAKRQVIVGKVFIVRTSMISGHDSVPRSVGAQASTRTFCTHSAAAGPRDLDHGGNFLLSRTPRRDSLTTLEWSDPRSATRTTDNPAE
jgi:hypothetical protein